MSTTSTCSSCGGPIAGDLLGGQCPRCLARTALGTRLRYLGDYELLDEIGRGGMGVVYRARQLSLNRVVAVKLLLHGSFASEQFLRRFHAEAETAASLQHPNIVAIHEVGLHEGQPYFSMDYVEGPSLAELVRERAVPPERTARYVLEVAKAIQYAHEQGILHRDLKPSNVLIDALNRPRITDFGLAKRLENTGRGALDRELTLAGQVLGAPSYLPPEQAGGNRGQAGTWSDVYGLGAILYHLLTGQPPFFGETITETLQQVQTKAPAPLRQLKEDVPGDLETICLKCLQKDPRDRYKSAAALAEDLRRWLAREVILAQPLTTRNRIWRACRRHPAVTVGVVVSLLAVGIGLWSRERHYALTLPPGLTDLLLVNASSELYLTDPRGSFWRKLPFKGVNVDVSPNRRQLCFERQDGAGDNWVFVSRLDGRGVRRAVRDATEARWLNDYTLIFQPLDLRSVWTIDLSTNRREKLFDWSVIRSNGFAGQLELSPNRKRLLTNPQNGAMGPSADVYVCDLDGGDAAVVWSDADWPDREHGTTDTCLVWLSGDRFAWCRHVKPGNRVQDMAIVTCRLGETNFQALTHWQGWKYPLTGSPDGRRIAYLTEDNPGLGQLELWTMNIDGTDPHRVSERKFALDCSTTVRWFRRDGDGIPDAAGL